MILKVVELVSGQVVSLGQGHSEPIQALAWTLDEKQLITGGDDSCFCVWNFYLGGLEESQLSSSEAPSVSQGGCRK